MRVAALYDIHGNIDALDAVLAELDAHSIDQIVVGGDIAWGPFPARTVARVHALGDDAVVIRGNADREVAARTDERGGLQDWVVKVNVWCADQLSDEDRRFLAGLPETHSVTATVGEVLFCHGTPTSDEEIVTPLTPDEELRASLGSVSQSVVVCGHTHSQFDRTVGTTRLVNAGSVGLPYEDAPGAYWALIDDGIHLRRTEYDFAAAAEKIKSSGCPHPDRFAAAVLSPTPRLVAIENFEKQRLTPDLG